MSSLLQGFRGSSDWNNDSNALVRKHRTDGGERRNQITVSGNNNGRIVNILNGQLKEINGNVDVGLFFLESLKCLFAKRTEFVSPFEFTIDYTYVF